MDIFFVISGFLITGLLVREAEATGRISFRKFWAKRIRRLVPAAVVMIVVTLPIGAYVSTVLSWDELGAAALASALYVSNFFFWVQGTDYFDTGSALSPYLHMWSLGVEEQYYLFWPFMIAGCFLVARAVGRARRVLLIGMGSVLVVSLLLSIVLTPLQPTSSFYLIHTRSWEFAAGALVSLTPHLPWLSSRLRASMISFAGVALIAYAALSFTEELAYPGAYALVPVVGTVLLIVGGRSRNVISRVLETRPFVWVGEVSYSWYLWHWPLAIFAIALFPDSWSALAISAAVSLGLAVLSRKWLEEPVRNSAWLSKSAWRTFGFALGSILCVAVVAATVVGAGRLLLQEEPMSTYAEAATAVPTNGCSDETGLGGVEDVCVVGDPAGERTIALIGDSHAGHWKAAFDRIGQDEGLRVLVFWKSACPSIDVAVVNSEGAQDTSCLAFRERTQAALSVVTPELVVISNSAGYVDAVRSAELAAVSATERDRVWADALRAQIQSFVNQGSAVTVFDDNPRMPFNPAACLTRLGVNASECSSTRSDALQAVRDLSRVTTEVVRETGTLPQFSVTDAMCSADRCGAVSDQGVPVYQDQTHLSRMWTETQLVPLKDFLRERLDSGT